MPRENQFSSAKADSLDARLRQPDKLAKEISDSYVRPVFFAAMTFIGAFFAHLVDT